MRFPLLFLIPVSLALYTCTRADAQGSAVPNTRDFPAQIPPDPVQGTVNPLPSSSLASWRSKILRSAFRFPSFFPLACDTTPNYEDTAPYPATPTKWTYKAIYRVGDHQVGQWSGEVSVIVGG